MAEGEVNTNTDNKEIDIPILFFAVIFFFNMSPLFVSCVLGLKPSFGNGF